jgi:hypothetical protein
MLGRLLAGVSAGVSPTTGLRMVGNATKVTGVSPLTVTVPSGSTIGNLLVLIVAAHDSTITPSIAFTSFQSALFGLNSYGYILYRVIDGTEGSSFTVGSTSAGDSVEAICFTVAGQSPTSPLSSWVLGSPVYSGTATVPASTTTIANSLWIQMGAQGAGGTGTLSGGTPAGSTVIAEITDNVNAGQLGVYYNQVSSIGSTGTASITFPSPNTSYGSGFIINPAPPPAYLFMNNLSLQNILLS